MDSPTTQKRGTVRLRIQFPVVIPATNGTPERHGLTRDVSQSGVFFYTESPLTLDEVVVFKMPMPGGTWTPVFCQGKVVRVEAGTPCGAAVAISQVTIA